MKHNWTYKKLGEVATYINGFAFKPSDWKLQGLPIIRIQNLNDPSAEYNFYDKEIAPKYIVNDGDILISWSASLGVYEWQRGKAVLNQHIFKVVFDKSDIDKHYLKYCVEAKLTDMSRLAHGATMRHIVKGDFDNTRIPIPSLDEQQAIVHELDGINRLIDLQEEQLREYDRLAQSLFYTTFGNNSSFPHKTIAEITSFITDGNWIESKDQSECGIRLVQTGNIGVGVYKDKEERARYISEATFKELQCTEVFPGDCLISRLPDPIGRACILPHFEGRAITAVDCTILRFKEIVLPEYFIQFAMSQTYFDQVNKYSTGATRKRISRKNLMSIQIPLPPLALQQSFAAQIEAIEQQKALVRKSLEETRTLLAARMQYYFE